MVENVGVAEREVRQDSSVVVGVLAFLGILLASINVFGGFTVTQRMLAMFRRA